ncbi:hypothetical protein Tco_1553962 [Tanacetum coccineum]
MTEVCTKRRKARHLAGGTSGRNGNLTTAYMVVVLTKIVVVEPLAMSCESLAKMSCEMLGTRIRHGNVRKMSIIGLDLKAEVRLAEQSSLTYNQEP